MDIFDRSISEPAGSDYGFRFPPSVTLDAHSERLLNDVIVDNESRKSFSDLLTDMVTDYLLEHFEIKKTVENTINVINLANNLVTIVCTSYTLHQVKQGRAGLWVTLLSNILTCIMNFANVIYKLCATFNYSRCKNIVALWIQEAAVGAQFHDYDFDSVSSVSHNSGSTGYPRTSRSSIYSTVNSYDTAMADLPSYLTLALSAISFLLCAGFYSCNVPTTSLAHFLKLKKDLTSEMITTKEGIISLLDDFGLTDIRGQNETFDAMQKLLERAERVRKFTHAELLYQSHIREEFNKVRHDIMKFITEPRNKELGPRFAPLRTYLCTHLAAFDVTLDLLNAYHKTGLRQATVGVVLEGPPGVGKSYLAEHILRQIGARLNYSSNIYICRLGTSQKYMPNYAEEELGILNEFQNSNGPDPFVTQINSMLSSDPLDFESAQVHAKNQPCRLKLVIFTANEPNYEFGDLREGPNIALVSRLIRFKVNDPLYRQNDRYRTYTHRQPSGSHLEIDYLRPNIQEPTCVAEAISSTPERMDVNRLVDMIEDTVKKQELQYLRSKLSDPQTLNDQSMVTTINARIAQLNVADTAHGSPTGSNFCVIRIQGPTNTGKTICAHKIAESVKELFRQDYVKVNLKYLQEKPDIKEPTTFIFDDFDFSNHLDKYLDHVNSLPNGSLIIITSNIVIPYEKLPSLSNSSIRSKFTQSFCGDNGLEINYSTCKNFGVRLFQESSDYCYRVDKTPYAHILQQDTQYSGIIRRFGLDDCIYIKPNLLTMSSLYNPPENSGIVYTTTNSAAVFNKTRELSMDDVYYDAIEYYLNFIRSGGCIRPTIAPPPSVTPDIVVQVRDLKQFIEASQTVSGYTAMFLRDDHPGGSVNANPTLFDRLAQRIHISDWRMPRTTNSENLEQVALTLSSKLRAACPNVTVQFTIHDKQFFLHKSLLYTSNRTVPADLYQIDGGTLLIKNTADAFIPISPSMLVNIVLLPRVLVTDMFYEQFNFKTLQYLRLIADKLVERPTLIAYREALANTRREITYEHSNFSAWTKFSLFIRQAPLALKIVGGLLGLASSIFAIYASIKFMRAFTTSSHAATDDPSPPDQDDYKYLEYTRGVINNEWNTPQEFARAQKIKDPTFDEGRFMKVREAQLQAFNDFDDARSGSAEKAMYELLLSMVSKPDNKSLPGICMFIRRCKPLQTKRVLDLMESLSSSVSSQSVTTKFNEPKSKHQFDSMIAKLQNNFVGVTGDYGSCYALAYKPGRFVTVSHIFRSINSYALIIHNGKTYQAKVLFLSRQQDLAFLYVRDKQLPMFKNLCKDFWKSPNKPHNANGYIVKPCVDRTVIVTGTISYTGTAMISRRDPKNPYYCPSDYVLFSDIHFDTQDFPLKKGDCGSILITCENDQCSIIGLYCGWSDVLSESIIAHTMGMPLESIDRLIPDESRSELPLPPDNEFAKKTMNYAVMDLPPYNAIFKDIVYGATTIGPEHGIPILGTLEACRDMRAPKMNKRMFAAPNIVSVNESKPAYFSSAVIPIEERANMPRSVTGKVMPLITEVKKMFQFRRFEPDVDLWNKSIEIVCKRHTELYPKAKPLRLFEVINGRVGTNINSMTMHSSAGPWFKIKYKIMQKEDLFVDMSPKDSLVPQRIIDTKKPAGKELSQHYNQMCTAVAAGIPVLHVVQDCPKVELIHVSKKKVRLFNNCDMVFNMVMKKYFGEILSTIVDFHNTSPIKTGMNPYKSIAFWASQKPKDWKPLSSDLKSFDKSFREHHFDAILKVLKCHVTDKEHEVAIETLLKSMTKGIHLFDGNLYVVCCNTSGNFMTNLMDCIVVEIGETYCYLSMVQKYSPTVEIRFLTFYHIDVNMLTAINGDDCSRRCAPELPVDMTDWIEWYDQIGFTLTLGKDAVTDLNFCSRDIIWCSLIGNYVCPLKLSSVVAIMLWIKKNSFDLLHVQFLGFLLEASLHDEETYDRLTSDLRKQMEYLKVDKSLVIIPDWTDQRIHFGRYMRGLETTPLVTSAGDEIFAQLIPGFEAAQPMTNYVGRMYEHMVKLGHNREPIVEFTYIGESRSWKCTLIYEGVTHEGIGTTKNASKQLAAKKFSDEGRFTLPMECDEAQGRRSENRYSVLVDIGDMSYHKLPNYDLYELQESYAKELTDQPDLMDVALRNPFFDFDYEKIYLPRFIQEVLQGFILDSIAIVNTTMIVSIGRRFFQFSLGDVHDYDKFLSYFNQTMDRLYKDFYYRQSRLLFSELPNYVEDFTLLSTRDLLLRELPGFDDIEENGFGQYQVFVEELEEFDTLPPQGTVHELAKWIINLAGDYHYREFDVERLLPFYFSEISLHYDDCTDMGFSEMFPIIYHPYEYFGSQEEYFTLF